MPPLVKLNRCSLILGRILFAALLLWLVPQVAWAEEDAAVASGAEEIPCRGLKPFKDLNELLYQFYINLDGDCLFKMPVSELEKIWETKILSRERGPGENFFKLRNSSEFYYKPDNSGKAYSYTKASKDAFYITASPSPRNPEMNYFAIQITNEFYKRRGSLFPDAKFPRSLPEPIAIKYKNSQYALRSMGESRIIGRHHPEYYYYHWYSSDKTGRISLGGEYEYGITRINIGRGKKSPNEQ